MFTKAEMRSINRLHRGIQALKEGCSLAEAKKAMDFIPTSELAEILEIDEQEIVGWIEDGTIDPQYVRLNETTNRE